MSIKKTMNYKNVVIGCPINRYGLRNVTYDKMALRNVDIIITVTQVRRTLSKFHGTMYKQGNIGKEQWTHYYDTFS